jgi:hypothetical protein
VNQSVVIRTRKSKRASGFFLFGDFSTESDTEGSEVPRNLILHSIAPLMRDEGGGLLGEGDDDWDFGSR